MRQHPLVIVLVGAAAFALTPERVDHGQTFLGFGLASALADGGGDDDDDGAGGGDPGGGGSDGNDSATAGAIGAAAENGAVSVGVDPGVAAAMGAAGTAAAMGALSSGGDLSAAVAAAAVAVGQTGMANGVDMSIGGPANNAIADAMMGAISTN